MRLPSRLNRGVGRHVAVLLSSLVISPVLLSQVPATNQPLQVKEGLWDVTVTNRISSNTPLSLPEATLNRLSPEQRERVLAALNRIQAKGQTENRQSCLTHERLVSGDIFGLDEGCTVQQIISTGQKLEATLQCGYAQRVTTIEKVSDTSFEGSQSIITHDPNDTQGAHDSRMDSTFSATWVGLNCSGVGNSADEAEEADQAPPKSKAEQPEQSQQSNDSGPAPVPEPTVAPHQPRFLRLCPTHCHSATHPRIRARKSAPC